MRGFVSLVGAGPGDPGLLTLRGRSAIARADTVLYDALIHPAILRHAPPHAEHLFVGKRGDESSTTQDEINHMLLLRASQGRRVARLKGGDALVFGRGAEEAEFLAAHGIAFEVVPGVSAALGATAYAGIPLTHRDHASSVALVTSREGPGKPADGPGLRAVAAADTIVIFMGLKRLAADMASLVASGRDPSTPAAVIAAGTHPEQRVVVGTVADIAAGVAAAAIRSPALVVVGDVVRVRERLRWWDGAGLHGKRVLVARAADQASATVEALVAEGAIPHEVPLIRFVGPTRPEGVAAAIDGLCVGAFDVVAFTSANGVAWTFDALRARGLDARALGRCAVVAVGPETERALQSWGVWPERVPRDHRGVAVADAISELRGGDLRGCRTLLARAEVAGDELPRRLREGGAAVSDVAVYRTEGPTEEDRARLRALWRDGLDAVLLTSGSVARHLVEVLGDALRPIDPGVVLAAIGPSTADDARAAGLPVHVEAAEHTVDGLLAALRDHYRQGVTAPP
jgi:uroporphyrinogen III methyltransferase/synthase